MNVVSRAPRSVPLLVAVQGVHHLRLHVAAHRLVHHERHAVGRAGRAATHLPLPLRAEVGTRDPHHHEQLPSRREMAEPGGERGAGVVVVLDQCERAGRVVDRGVPAGQVEARPVSVVQGDADTRRVGVSAADRQHVSRAVEAVDVEAGLPVVEEQAAVAAPELERRSVAALDRGAEQVAVVVGAVGREPAVVRLGDGLVVGLVDRERVAYAVVDVHQPRTAGMTSAANRSRPSRSNGARIARFTCSAPAPT